MPDTLADRFESEARLAVGRALLFRISKTGGSYGYGQDEIRAAKEAEKMQPEDLYDLLLDVARRAVEQAEREARTNRLFFVDEVRRLAEASDSLSLWRFVERHGPQA